MEGVILSGREERRCQGVRVNRKQTVGEWKDMGMKRALNSPVIKESCYFAQNTPELDIYGWNLNFPGCWLWNKFWIIASVLYIFFFFPVRKNISWAQRDPSVRNTVRLNSSRRTYFSFVAFYTETKEPFVIGYVTATEHRRVDNCKPLKSLH